MSSKKDCKEIAVRGKDVIDRQAGEPTRSGNWYLPHVDIYDDGEAVNVVADMPGVAKEDLDIDVRDKILTISGPVKEPEGRSRPAYSEYGVGGFSRRFNLGSDVDPARIEAELKDGVLKVVLRKADRLRPRKVEIKAG